jgi:cell wall-associated NlpC family hydrolase
MVSAVRPSRPILRALLGVAVAFAVLLSGSTHAYADPSIAEIERQIDAEWNKLEPAIEQYNNVHGQLKANQARLATLQHQLQPLQLQVDVAMARVGELAGHYYRSGQGLMMNAVLSGGSPEDFVYKLTLVNEMAHVQRTRIDVVASARDKYAADKKQLDDLIAQLSAQDADLAVQKKDLESRIAALQKLRQKVYGTNGSTGALKPVACPVEYDGGKGGTAANRACSLIGKPYHYGSSGPDSFDCSGMTMTAWAAAGVSLPHFTGAQWKIGKSVAKADLRPGDLVFFYSDLHHVGLYVGGGWMVHAPQTGDYVRMAKIEGRPVTGYRRPA